MEGSTRAIYVMQSHSGGMQWFKPARISDPGVDAVYPRAVDVAGGFLVAWAENEKGRAAALKMRRLAN